MGYSNSIEKGTVTMCQNDILSTTGILANFGTFVAGAENGKIVLLHPNVMNFLHSRATAQ